MAFEYKFFFAQERNILLNKSKMVRSKFCTLQKKSGISGPVC